MGGATPALACGGGASVLYFVAALLALHVARRDLPPRSHYVSEYARGELGWVMTSAFVTLGIGSLLLAGAVLAAFPAPAATILAAQLAAWGVAIGGAGVFRTGARGTPAGRAATVHRRAAAIAFAAILLAMWLLAGVAMRSDAWRSLRWPALGIAVGASLAYFALHRAAGSAPDRVGLAQRVYLACVSAWLLLLAAHVWGIAAR